MNTKELLNYTPHLMMGVKENKGNMFGIELELEGRNVGLRDIATKGWQRHEDGSLRGESIEYITAGAKTLDECKKLVDELFKKFEENGVKFNESIRTSTHVHLNFSDKPIKQSINFFSLFTVFEELLQFYSGEDRVGNLFCIGSRDAEGIIGVLASGIGRGSLDRFAGDRYKYSACNLSTLYKFGTVEVRTMRGASSADQVNRWLEILNDLYEYSLRMKSPAELVNNLSMLGAEGLTRDVFKPENFRELMKTFPAVRTLHTSLMDGARLIQLFAYEFDEDFKAEFEVKEKKGSLPVIIQQGQFVGQSYSVWKPDGTIWNLRPRLRGGNRIRPNERFVDFWQDGDVCADDHRIEWNEERQRFIVRYPDGEIYECPWVRHHAIAQEPAGPLQNMPGGRWAEAEDDEPEEDFEDAPHWNAEPEEF